MVSPGRPECENPHHALQVRVRLRPERQVSAERMPGDDQRCGVRSQFVHRPLNQGRHVVQQNAVAQLRGIWKAIQKLSHVKSDDGITVRCQSLGKFLVRLPEPEVVAKKEHRCLGTTCTGNVRIEIEWLALELGIPRPVG